jgi:hypothetical protein
MYWTFCIHNLHRAAIGVSWALAEAVYNRYRDLFEKIGGVIEKEYQCLRFFLLPPLVLAGRRRK